MKPIVAKTSAAKEPQMNIQKNARLTPRSREVLVHRTQPGEKVHCRKRLSGQSPERTASDRT